MNENKDNQNTETEQYDLYTEHIVGQKKKKAKMIAKKVLILVAAALLFGLVAGVIMLIVYKTGYNISEPKPAKPSITIATTFENPTPFRETSTTSIRDITIETKTSEHTDPTGETTNPQQTTIWNKEIEEKLKDIQSTYTSLGVVAQKAFDSSVVVKSLYNLQTKGVSFQNTTEEFGVIIAVQGDEFFVLTLFTPNKDASEYRISLNNGEMVNAQLAGYDANTGFAVFRALVPENTVITPIKIGNCAALKTGDVLVAAGEIHGLVNTYSYGIATGVNKPVTEVDADYKVIYTDIVGSNIGFGVLVDLSGEVKGFITSKYNMGSSLIMAYSADCLTKTIENLINSVNTAYFGVKGMAITEEMRYESELTSGVYITQVEPNSPAYKAGVQAGDIITAFGDTEITSMEDISKFLHGKDAGHSISVYVNRMGKNGYKGITLSATLSEK